MTGFSTSTLLINIAKQTADQENINLNCTLTLKSLNSRFFETNCKLPYQISQIETDLIKLFKSKLYRGNIYFTLYMTNSQALTSSVEPSLPIISQYVKASEIIKNKFGLPGQLTIDNLLQLPNIFEIQEQTLNNQITNDIIKAVEDLIAKLIEARSQEGSKLSLDLKNRIKAMADYIQEIEPRAKFVMQEKKNLLVENLNKILQEANQSNIESQNILLQNQLDKMDVHEEIVRFKSHLENLSDILDSNENENGKKIDFTLQELLREINTLSAKCPDSIISSLVINTKVELEKAREQAQNIV